MKTIDPKIVIEKYDEISRLENRSERVRFLNKQSEEMKVALWLENINRKIKGIELSAKQKEILDVIRKKFITVEFFKSPRGKSEAEAGQEYNDIMGRASDLLGRDMMRELFGILGDSKTMKCS